MDVLRKLLAGFAAHEVHCLGNDLTPIFGSELQIGCDTALPSRRGDDRIEFVLADTEYDACEHGDETPVSVPRKARVAGQLRKSRDGGIVEPEVEDRVHHARHRNASAAADGDEQRISPVAEALARAAFQIAQRGVDLVP